MLERQQWPLQSRRIVCPFEALNEEFLLDIQRQLNSVTPEKVLGQQIQEELQRIVNSYTAEELLPTENSLQIQQVGNIYTAEESPPTENSSVESLLVVATEPSRFATVTNKELEETISRKRSTSWKYNIILWLQWSKARNISDRIEDMEENHKLLALFVYMKLEGKIAMTILLIPCIRDTAPSKGKWAPFQFHSTTRHLRHLTRKNFETIINKKGNRLSQKASTTYQF